MNRESFQRWLENYGRAWERRDARAAAELFPERATYQETPFVEPLRGREAILAYWANVCRTQENVHFGFDVLAVDEEAGLAHWWATFARLPQRKRLALDGIFFIALDSENRATSLREWWHRKDI
jgi:SnoaL-like domain